MDRIRDISGRQQRGTSRPSLTNLVSPVILRNLFAQNKHSLVSCHFLVHGSVESLSDGHLQSPPKMSVSKFPAWNTKKRCESIYRGIEGLLLTEFSGAADARPRVKIRDVTFDVLRAMGRRRREEEEDIKVERERAVNRARGSRDAICEESRKVEIIRSEFGAPLDI